MPRKADSRLKTTVVSKDHRENERFKQRFFLGRPQFLVGFPSCKHSKRYKGRGKALVGRMGFHLYWA